MTRTDSVVPERVTAAWLREFEKDLTADLNRAAEVVKKMDVAKARGDDEPVATSDLAWIAEVVRRRDELLPQLRKQAAVDTAREELRLSRLLPTMIAVYLHGGGLLALVIAWIVASYSWTGLIAGIATLAAGGFLASSADERTGIPIAVDVIAVVVLIVGLLAVFGLLPVVLIVAPFATCAMTAWYRELSGPRVDGGVTK